LKLGARVEGVGTALAYRRSHRWLERGRRTARPASAARVHRDGPLRSRPLPQDPEFAVLTELLRAERRGRQGGGLGPNSFLEKAVGRAHRPVHAPWCGWAILKLRPQTRRTASRIVMTGSPEWGYRIPLTGHTSFRGWRVPQFSCAPSGLTIPARRFDPRCTAGCSSGLPEVGAAWRGDICGWSTSRRTNQVTNVPAPGSASYAGRRGEDHPLSVDKVTRRRTRSRPC